MRAGSLLVGMAALFLAALAGIHLIEMHARDDLISDEAAAHARLLDAWLADNGRPLRLFVDSYARRTSFTRPTEPTRAASPLDTLRAGLRTFGLTGAWILEADGRTRLQTSDDPALVAPPLSTAQLNNIPTRRTEFFLERGGALYRVRGSRLAADGTHPQIAPGWLFAANRWDPGTLSRPRFPIEGRVFLLAPAAAGEPATEEMPVRLERVFQGADRKPLRVLRLEVRPRALDLLESNDAGELAVMAIFGVATFCLLGFCIYRWVIVPAATMQRILGQADPVELQTLRTRGGYLGRLADLVHHRLETQRQLEAKIQERVHLGRELHDGAIQTIYAAGMGVASARAQLRQDPAAAERLLDDTRAELNATIVDLRSHIAGAESEPRATRQFSEAVRAITSLMAAAGTVQFSIEIDDAIAAELPTSKRMHVLQIVREAASNAVRHSQPGRVTITLRREAAAIVVEIVDDGQGFAAGSTDDGGRGLPNLKARAHQLGGTITLDHHPGGGTVVRLLLPP